jgi:hypothetical protein
MDQQACLEASRHLGGQQHTLQQLQEGAAYRMAAGGDLEQARMVADTARTSAAGAALGGSLEGPYQARLAAMHAVQLLSWKLLQGLLLVLLV